MREDLTGPFEMALGDDFAKLPLVVRAAHTQGPVSRFTGTARVMGARGPAWIAARLFGFPHSAEASPVTVKKRRLGPGHERWERWERTIGASRFRSEIRYAGPGRATEKFGPFTFTLAPTVENGRLVMSIKSWRVGWLPLPGFLAPRSTASEAATEDGSLLFDVPISVPLLGRLTHYKGVLTLHDPDERSP